MSVFPKYDRYKDSGVDWLEEIPAGWEMKRSKRVFAQRKERARPDDQQLSATQAYGVIPQAEYEKREGRNIVKISLHLDKRKHVELDDFVISMRSFQGGLERAWSSGAIRSSYTILQPLVEIAPSYFTYFFKTPQYIRALQSTGNFIRDGQDLDWRDFKYLPLTIPPKPEQDRIVTFLDRKTAEIDALIAKKQRQIELLDEQKAILINRAVTRGLNPNAKLKPTGIEWIGKIPEHWEVKKLKYLAQINPSTRLSPSDLVTFLPMELVGADDSLSVKPPVELKTLPDNLTTFSRGDVLIAKITPCFENGKGADLSNLPTAKGVGSTEFHVLRPLKTTPRFLRYLASSAGWRLVAERFMQGSAGQKRVTTEYLANSHFPLPPQDEQREVVAEAIEIREQFSQATTKTEEQIDSLKTLRSTLIAHAVTGRIKV